MTETIVYIGLGSNIADRAKYINDALAELKKASGIKVVKVSDISETKPLDGKGGGYDSDSKAYLNGAAEIATNLSCEKLLEVTSEIENKLGRKRTAKWDKRTIDLDVLLYGDEIIATEKLTVPHSQLHLRSFVLGPMTELNGQLNHPILNQTMVVLNDRLNGCDFAIEDEGQKLISVAGLIGVGKTTLAKPLAKLFKAEIILEPYDENPFLADEYAGDKTIALDCEMFFLNYRAKQFAKNGFKKANTVAAVSDCLFDKGLMFAENFLTEKQLACYKKQYDQVTENIKAPSVVVYITDTAENCLKRINRRNRGYEQQITIEYLSHLSNQYEELLGNWTKCPILKFDKAGFDSEKPADVKRIFNQIRCYV